MSIDSKKVRKEEHKLWFQNIHREFLADNRGCANILDYIEKEYKGNKDYWAKVARGCGVKCHKRGGIYYIAV